MDKRALHGGSLLLPVFLLSMALALPALAIAPEEGPFTNTWYRTDEPVAAGQATRTWLWGPAALTEGFFEPYVEAHNNGHFVQYFDNARMEISHIPDADIGSI